MGKSKIKAKNKRDKKMVAPKRKLSAVKLKLKKPKLKKPKLKKPKPNKPKSKPPTHKPVLEPVLEPDEPSEEPISKRVRKDTFGANSEKDNADYFDSIFTGKNRSFRLDTAHHAKTDYKGRTRHCWIVRATKDHDAIRKQIKSAKTYRFAILWSVYHAKKYWKRGDASRRLAALKLALPNIKGRRGDHSRHRCGHNWCCNPGHIIIGSRKANENDKHFHYFLNHEDEDISKKFMKTFGWLCKRERLF